MLVDLVVSGPELRRVTKGAILLENSLSFHRISFVILGAYSTPGANDGKEENSGNNDAYG